MMRSVEAKIILVAALVIAVVFLAFFPPVRKLWLGQPQSPHATAAPVQIKTLPLKDNPFCYDTDTNKVETLYLTTNAYTSVDTGKTYSLSDLNVVTSSHLAEEPRVQVAIQTPEGPLTGIMQVRGQSTRLAVQKSFKIKLGEGQTWHDQTIINLNKHAFDKTRLLNKLGYDLYHLLPDSVSLRTQFVHVFIRDLSKGGSKYYVDYGLFTQVEEPDKNFLKAHGLSENGSLYKAQLFEFYRYPDILKPASDPSYNKSAFDSILEPKTGQDNAKLIRMLDDVNNYSLDFDTVFAKYFDKDNYLTWLAFNLLMGNADTMSQNFLLYSPADADKWYFIPWDLDGSLSNTTIIKVRAIKLPAEQMGLAKYWSATVHKRFFSNPQNVQELSKKIEMVYKILNRQSVRKMSLHYLEEIKPIVMQQPDYQHTWYYYQDKIEQFINAFPDIIESYRKNYYDTLECPMPIFLAPPAQKGANWTFSWSSSYDLQGDLLTYDLQISKTPDFSQRIFERKGIILTQTTVQPNLKAGTYFWRVVVRDSKGNVQYAFDRYRADVTTYIGLLELEVKG